MKAADIIACEDTRRTRRLLSHFGIPTPRLVSYRDETEMRASENLSHLLLEGKTVALCSDAGYPCISDPGYRLLAAAIENDLAMEVIPGASSVPVALLLSGLPVSSYTFKGYPPKKSGQLRRFFEEEKELPHTLILFESPYRVGKTLAAAFEVLSDRRAAVCAELTKKFERVDRNFLGELAEAYADRKIKGEVVIVIAGNNPKFCRSE